MWSDIGGISGATAGDLGLDLGRDSEVLNETLDGSGGDPFTRSRWEQCGHVLPPIMQIALEDTNSVTLEGEGSRWRIAFLDRTWEIYGPCFEINMLDVEPTQLTGAQAGVGE